MAGILFIENGTILNFLSFYINARLTQRKDFLGPKGVLLKLLMQEWGPTGQRRSLPTPQVSERRTRRLRPTACAVSASWAASALIVDGKAVVEVIDNTGLLVCFSGSTHGHECRRPITALAISEGQSSGTGGDPEGRIGHTSCAFGCGERGNEGTSCGCHCGGDGGRVSHPFTRRGWGLLCFASTDGIFLIDLLARQEFPFSFGTAPSTEVIPCPR